MRCKRKKIRAEEGDCVKKESTPEKGAVSGGGVFWGGGGHEKGDQGPWGRLCFAGPGSSVRFKCSRKPHLEGI